MGLNDLLLKNSILQKLPLSERELLVPSCEIIDLHLGDTIEEAGRPIQFLHFPIDAAISFTNEQDQEHLIEVTVTGREGCSGASIVLGDNRPPCLAIVPIHGIAVRLATDIVTDNLSRVPYLYAALARYNLLIIKIAVISVGCSQFHSPTQRLARWLKVHSQRTGIESFPFSNDFLALQVGVDPGTVKARLMDFQNQGLVQLGHNSLVVTDHEGLERETCHCYTLAKESVEEYLRSLGDLSKSHSRMRTKYRSE